MKMREDGMPHEMVCSLVGVMIIQKGCVNSCLKWRRDLELCRVYVLFFGWIGEG